MSARCWFNTGPVELEVVIWSNTFIYAAILRIINKLMMGVGKITLSKRKECQLRNSKINIQCQLSAIQVKSILEQSLYHFDWSLSWWFMYMSRAKRHNVKCLYFQNTADSRYLEYSVSQTFWYLEKISWSLGHLLFI